jgi:hypothetical protein
MLAWKIVVKGCINCLRNVCGSIAGGQERSAAEMQQLSDPLCRDVSKATYRVPAGFYVHFALSIFRPG